MNLYLVLASFLTVLVGVIHSVLGEKLIFSQLRSGQIVPTNITFPLKERHIRIIWATWHIVSLFGFGIAALLYWLSLPSTVIPIGHTLKMAIAIPMFLSSLLVFWSTKAKHPGWVGLSLIGGLVSFS